MEGDEELELINNYIIAPIIKKLMTRIALDLHNEVFKNTHMIKFDIQVFAEELNGIKQKI